jgi:hypothetical protein
MGLLDDAIREHLELKRRRGADPEEVAREQREALEPVASRAGPSETASNTEEHPLEPDLAPVVADEPAQTQAIREDMPIQPGHAEAVSAEASPRTAVEEEASVAETAELDMNAVFEDEEAASDPAQHARAHNEHQTEETLGAAGDARDQEPLGLERGPQQD